VAVVSARKRGYRHLWKLVLCAVLAKQSSSIVAALAEDLSRKDMARRLNAYSYVRRNVTRAKIRADVESMRCWLTSNS
jgi:hypothetical protein